MKHRSTAIILLSSVFFFSCVSSKKFKKSQADYAELQTKHGQLQTSLNTCNDEKAELARQKTSLENDNAGLNDRIADLKKQIEF